MLKGFIGLGVPFIGIVLLLPWANSVEFAPLGVPFSFVWLFLWFFLTAGCLGICWWCFDRHASVKSDKE